MLVEKKSRLVSQEEPTPREDSLELQLVDVLVGEDGAIDQTFFSAHQLGKSTGRTLSDVVVFGDAHRYSSKDKCPGDPSDSIIVRG
jgi:hypothetical protein